MNSSKDVEKPVIGDAIHFQSLLEKLSDPNLAYAELLQAAITHTTLDQLNEATLTRVFKVNENYKDEPLPNDSPLFRIQPDITNFNRKINKYFHRENSGEKHIVLTKKNITLLLRILRKFVNLRLNQSPYFKAIFDHITNNKEKEKLMRSISVSLCHNLFKFIEPDEKEKLINTKNFSLFFGDVNSNQHLSANEIYQKLLASFKNKMTVQLRSFLGLCADSEVCKDVSTRSLNAIKDYTKLAPISPTSIDLTKILFGIKEYLLNFESNKEKLRQLTRYMQYLGEKVLNKIWIELLTDILLVSRTSHNEEKFRELNTSFAEILPTKMYKKVQEKFKDKNEKKQQKKHVLSLDHPPLRVKKHTIVQGDDTAEWRQKIRERHKYQLFPPAKNEKKKVKEGEKENKPKTETKAI